jgi:signal transduction histidine kinase
MDRREEATQEAAEDAVAGGQLAELRSRLAEAHAELAEMRDRDAHLRMAMEASRVVAYQWDIRRDRVMRLRGTSVPGQALEDAGDFESVVARVWPGDQAAFRADIAAALASEDGIYRTEVRYRRADGVVRWISESGRVVRGPDGKPSSMTGFTLDITERKEAEEALRRADALLREQNTRKDEFLAMLAHELRNPLAPIRNAVQIMRLVPPGDAAATTAREMIERQLAHLVRLVDDLLEVSRVSRGKITLRRSRIDLRAVVRDSLEAASALLTARGHAVESRQPPEPVMLDGDATRLAQVVSNLLNNAAKYTDSGGRVAIDLAVVMGEARLAIADTGRGLDAAEISRVFELFYQGARDMDRAEGGLGLGLSLVKALVELHGGRVTAESPGRGRGSTFTVWLPLAS